MRIAKSPGSRPLGTIRTSWIPVAPVILAAVLVSLALSGLAFSQAIVYKTVNSNGRGWSDGTLGGGYIKPDPDFKPTRTPDGQPDIQGIWHATTFGRQAQSSIEALPNDPKVVTRVFDPPDGKIPYQPWARAMVGNLHAHYMDPLAACVPTGVPRQMAYVNNLFIQVPGELLVVTEALQNFRHIPVDGHPHIGKEMKLWMGDSRGHWEGNTLVIDVTSLSDKAWIGTRGDFHSNSAHVTERITPIAQDILQYQATIEDPVVYDKPWTEAFPLFRNKTKNYQILEENCADGNRSVDTQTETGLKLWTGLDDAR